MDNPLLEDYRSAFWLTFAEDHGLINEWSMHSPIPDTIAPNEILPIGQGLLLGSAGMIPDGLKFTNE